MRIGIFGDSYADTVHGSRDYTAEFLEFSWPGIIQAKNPTYHLEYFAISGTSHWYSYTKFLETYKRFDAVIFVHTNPSRWPNLPDTEGLGTQWNIGYCDGTETLDQLNKYFFDLFPDNLRTFISDNIFRSVCELCEKQNIFLINIIAFDDQYDHINNNKFPVICEIDKISWIEKILYRNAEYNFNSFLSENKFVDQRFCHLNKHNNEKLADMIIDILKHKKIDLTIKLTELDIWQLIDDHLNSLYEKN